jgi:hypothetical protein
MIFCKVFYFNEHNILGSSIELTPLLQTESRDSLPSQCTAPWIDPQSTRRSAATPELTKADRKRELRNQILQRVGSKKLILPLGSCPTPDRVNGGDKGAFPAIPLAQTARNM